MTFIPEMKTWYGLAATLGTLGRFTNMPGTIGSIAACLIWLAAGGLPAWVIALAAAAGTFVSGLYEKKVERKDPPEVVIDEVVGCWIACWGFDLRFAVVSLFLFRIIDIIKPAPVKYFEKLPGGFGIMADDVAGGIMTNLLMRGIMWLFFGGGLAMICEIVGR